MRNLYCMWRCTVSCTPAHYWSSWFDRFQEAQETGISLLLEKRNNFNITHYIYWSFQTIAASLSMQRQKLLLTVQLNCAYVYTCAGWWCGGPLAFLCTLCAECTLQLITFITTKSADHTKWMEVCSRSRWRWRDAAADLDACWSL